MRSCTCPENEYNELSLPQLRYFREHEACPIIVTASCNINGLAADLSDINGVSCRQRRRHAKSRSGCIACKKRRVKCDNAFPSCRHCMRRREPCSLSGPLPQCATRTSALSNSSGLHLRRLRSHDFYKGLSILQIALLNNFAENTVTSLPFGRNLWHDHVVPLAVNHGYLMHAVLLVSAKHLSFLAPSNFEYHQASLFHLSKLLPQYREEVSKPLSIQNVDSMLSTSILLLYFVWSHVDIFDMEDPSCFIKDQLFAMTIGVREMFLSAWFVLSTGQSIFSKVTPYHQMSSIKRVAMQCSKTPLYFERFFYERYQQQSDNFMVNIGQNSPRSISHFPDIQNGDINTNNKDLWCAVTQPQDQLLIGFLDAAVRLAPLSSIASELQVLPQPFQSSTPNARERGTHQLPGTSQPTPEDLAQHVFSWPILSSPGVLRLLERKDECMIFLLYQFYKAVKVILPKMYWWAHQRADKMISIFHQNLAQSILDPLDSVKDFAGLDDIVIRATGFAVQAIEKWRRYCLVHAASSPTGAPCHILGSASEVSRRSC